MAAAAAAVTEAGDKDLVCTSQEDRGSDTSNANMTDVARAGTAMVVKIIAAVFSLVRVHVV